MERRIGKQTYKVRGAIESPEFQVHPLHFRKKPKKLFERLATSVCGERVRADQQRNVVVILRIFQLECNFDPRIEAFSIRLGIVLFRLEYDFIYSSGFQLYSIRRVARRQQGCTASIRIGLAFSERFKNVDVVAAWHMIILLQGDFDAFRRVSGGGIKHVTCYGRPGHGSRC